MTLRWSSRRAELHLELSFCLGEFNRFKGVHQVMWPMLVLLCHGMLSGANEWFIDCFLELYGVMINAQDGVVGYISIIVL